MQNTLTNTPECKARFLNQYALTGLQMKCIAKNFQLPDKRFDGVVFNIRGDYALCLSNDNHLDFFDMDEWQLPLRSISSLTDEEVIEFGKVCLMVQGHYLKDAIIKMYTHKRPKAWIALDMVVKGADYLRSIGVFIPYMGEYQQILDWGWCVLDTGLAVKIQEVEG